MAAVQVFLRFFCGCFHGKWFTVYRIGIKEMMVNLGCAYLYLIFVQFLRIVYI